MNLALFYVLVVIWKRELENATLKIHSEGSWAARRWVSCHGEVTGPWNKEKGLRSPLLYQK